jgi:hypothetical protein
MVKKIPLWALLLIGALGCGDPTSGAPTSTDATDSDAALQLSPTQLLIRASLDLRGVRPSPSDLQRVAEEPGAADGIIDGYLDDDRFADRVKEAFAPAFRTRIDFYDVGEGNFANIDALGEEPLNLVAYLAVNNLPMTGLVQSTLTFANAGLMQMWPLEHAPQGDDWIPPGTAPASYTDGRPAAGVLSMNAMWWRHTSTLENANRGRANALSRALLCTDFLERPIEFPRDINLTDSESIHNAIRENPGCTACHATLDPLASYLWGFMNPDARPESRALYRPERERDWMRTTERPPAFFGQPGENLADLGRQIAGDPRFVGCIVKRVYTQMMGRRAALEDDGALAEHREAFLAGELRLKALYRSMIRDPRYRGQALRSSFGGHPDPAVLKLITPDILGSEIESLTGYRMQFDGRDALSLDYGLRAISGGSDHGASTDPSTGLVLVQRRLAEAAARAVVDGITSDGAVGAALDAVDLDAPPRAEDLAALMEVIQSRVVEPEGEEVAALMALFDELVVFGSENRIAWAGLLTAMLGDPDLLLY